MNSLNPQKNPTKQLLLPFLGEKDVAQRGYMTC